MSKKLMSVGSLKTGSYVVFDGVACKVKSIQTSRPGKHGHAKCRVEVASLIDNKKIIKVMPGHENVEVPIIEKKTAQVLSVHGSTVNVMDMQTYETFDLKVPDNLKGEVKEGAQVSYWVILDDKILKQVK
ncbi:translation initiation factor IF-5A [archaeon]|nr:translation initiation factor IF-5A [archaeon]|tara:strand:+ start:80 stop:469 length:390 start_codon:yes stop_codon:yes gene_type:complete